MRAWSSVCLDARLLFFHAGASEDPDRPAVPLARSTRVIEVGESANCLAGSGALVHGWQEPRTQFTEPLRCLLPV